MIDLSVSENEEIFMSVKPKWPRISKPPAQSAGSFRPLNYYTIPHSNTHFKCAKHNNPERQYANNDPTFFAQKRHCCDAFNAGPHRRANRLRFQK